MDTNNHTQLHSFLSQRIKAFDQALISQFSPSLARIEHIRYQEFRQCVIQSNDTPKCYKKSLQFDPQVNFDKHGLELEECINKAAGTKRWEKQGQKCMQAYQRGVRGAVERQIQRILKRIT